jgi:hypothetical protein
VLCWSVPDHRTARHGGLSSTASVRVTAPQRLPRGTPQTSPRCATGGPGTPTSGAGRPASSRARHRALGSTTARRVAHSYSMGRAAPGGGDMGVLDGVPATVPRLPARGRAVCADRERCHDWHGLPPTQAQEWLGRGPTGRIRGA